jgi:hypothetical protein
MAVTAAPEALLAGAGPRRVTVGHAPRGLAAGTASGRVPISATLAAQEVLARKRQAGETVLPLAFGEAGLPVHPALRAPRSTATRTSPRGGSIWRGGTR